MSGPRFSNDDPGQDEDYTFFDEHKPNGYNYLAGEDVTDVLNNYEDFRECALDLIKNLLDSDVKLSELLQTPEFKQVMVSNNKINKVDF